MSSRESIASCLSSRRAEIQTPDKPRASASVAIILRPRQLLKNVTSAGNNGFEILFIKRAFNPRDRWSGHVAFPGGRIEENETPLAAAIRETQEEIGVQLDSPDYEYLGRLNDRFTTSFLGSRLLISCFVFLQRSAAAPAPRLSPAECVGCRWVPLEYFLSQQLEQKHVEFKFTRGLLGRTLGPVLPPAHFNGYILPVPASPVDDVKFDSSDPSPLAYHLWGITLDLVDDLLHTCYLFSRHSFRALEPAFASYTMLPSFVWCLITLPPTRYRIMKFLVFCFAAAASAACLRSGLALMTSRL